MSVVTLYQDEQLTIAHWEMLALSIWRSRGTIEHVNRLAVEQMKHIEKYRRVSYMAVIGSMGGAQVPADVRKRAQEVSAQTAPHTLASSMVILETGLAAVLARGILTAIVLAGNTGGSHAKVSKSVAEGARWLQTVEGQSPEIAANALFVSEIEHFVTATIG